MVQENRGQGVRAERVRGLTKTVPALFLLEGKMMRINKAMRILSVFLAVVIVSVGFMQPVAYANAAAGVTLVMLVASLLVSCGLVFANQAQLDAAAEHAVSVMPSDLKTELSAVLGSAGPSGPNLTQLILAGATAVILLTPVLYKKAKAWINETFGMNEETVAAGGVGAPVSVEPSVVDDVMTVTDSAGNVIYIACKGGDYGSDAVSVVKTYGEYYVGDNPANPALYMAGKVVKIQIGNKVRRYTMDSDSRDLYIDEIDLTTGNVEVILPQDRLGAKSWQAYWIFVLYEYRGRKYVNAVCGAWSIEGKYEKEIDFVTGATNAKYIPDTITWLDEINSSLYGINADAYNYTPSDEAETIPIAIVEDTATLVTKGYQDVVNDYNANDYDWAAAVETIKAELERLNAQLDALGSNALSSESDRLKKELEALYGLMAQQGSDYRKHVKELDKALYDAYTAISTLTGALEKNETDTDEKIASLTDALAQSQAQVQELIDAMTKTGEVVVPDVPKVEAGQIDWSILLGIKIFDMFPFCLPKDLYNFVSVLAAEPKEPVFVFDIFAGKFGEAGKITLDFKQFENIRLLVRNGIFILLVIGLVGATKKYIWTGGG